MSSSSSWPITSEVPVVDALGQCALCDEVFPFVNVLSCRRLKGGKVPICLTCHQRFHPGCTIAQTVLRPSHYECRVCGLHTGTIVCALCSLPDSADEILEGVLMCGECSADIHDPTKEHHADHFYPVADPTVVPIKGPIQWHNYVDLRCEISANQSQPHVPPTMSQPSRAPISTNQHRENIQRVEAPGPGVRPLAIGGNSGQSQGVKQKGDGGSFERLTKAM